LKGFFMRINKNLLLVLRSISRIILY
jgi:hypothetical protein